MNTKKKSSLVQEYFNLLKGTGATVYTANGCPVKALKVLDGDAKSIFIQEDDRGHRYNTLVTDFLAISPKATINDVYSFPEVDSTPRMKVLRVWTENKSPVEVFMPNGYRLTGTIKSYGKSALVLHTSAYGTPARDVLLLETSTLRVDNDATRK